MSGGQGAKPPPAVAVPAGWSLAAPAGAMAPAVDVDVGGGGGSGGGGSAASASRGEGSAFPVEWMRGGGRTVQLACGYLGRQWGGSRGWCCGSGGVAAVVIGKGGRLAASVAGVESQPAGWCASPRGELWGTLLTDVEGFKADCPLWATPRLAAAESI